MKTPDLLQKLYSLKRFGLKTYTLENIHALNSLLGDPISSYASLHIAGTNGKGSVSTKLSNGLINAGFKVGLFTSPHISCFRERVQLNGKLISEKDAERILIHLFQQIEKHAISATFFEVTTMLALLYFAEQQVDWAVIEVGMGGKRDATNIITPKLSVITSISLDHKEILGDTIEKITLEKAGIIKPNVPVVIGPTVSEKIIAPLTKHLHPITGPFPTYDEENSAITHKALELLSIPEHHIQSALETRPPCRMEIHTLSSGQTVIFDVAHNPEGLNRLFQAIRSRFPHHNIHCICGFSKKKDIETCLTILKKQVSGIHFVQDDEGETVSVELLEQTAHSLGFTHIHEDISDIFQSPHDLILVCGSFYIMNSMQSIIANNFFTSHDSLLKGDL